MRLTEAQRFHIREAVQAVCGDIREAVQAVCGDNGVAFLFGSRVDDAGRGGDIDLLVEVDPLEEDPFSSRRTRLSRELKRRLGDRKIDVLLLERGRPTLFQRVVRPDAVAI